MMSLLMSNFIGRMSDFIVGMSVNVDLSYFFVFPLIVCLMLLFICLISFLICLISLLVGLTLLLFLKYV